MYYTVFGTVKNYPDRTSLRRFGQCGELQKVFYGDIL